MPQRDSNDLVPHVCLGLKWVIGEGKDFVLARWKGKARRKSTERSLYREVPILGSISRCFVQRPSNGPSCRSEMEAYWRQAHSSSTWKEDKVAGIHTQMSDIAFVGVR
jgi:hypothetical protein